MLRFIRLLQTAIASGRAHFAHRSGALNDVRRQLAFCENGSSVRFVMVAGKALMEDGQLLTIDEDVLKAEVRELMIEYREQHRNVDHWARTLEPIYRQMYQRCLQEEVALRRNCAK